MCVEVQVGKVDYVDDDIGQQVWLYVGVIGQFVCDQYCEEVEGDGGYCY